MAALLSHINCRNYYYYYYVRYMYTIRYGQLLVMGFCRSCTIVNIPYYRQKQLYRQKLRAVIILYPVLSKADVYVFRLCISGTVETSCAPESFSCFSRRMYSRNVKTLMQTLYYTYTFICSSIRFPNSVTAHRVV